MDSRGRKPSAIVHHETVAGYLTRQWGGRVVAPDAGVDESLRAAAFQPVSTPPGLAPPSIRRSPSLTVPAREPVEFFGLVGESGQRVGEFAGLGWCEVGGDRPVGVVGNRGALDA